MTHKKTITVKKNYNLKNKKHIKRENGWIRIHPTHTWAENVHPNLTINNI